MAKILELCGSPGVGKTTIYLEIALKWKKKYNWLPAHRLYPKEKLSYRSFSALALSAAKKLTGKVDRSGMEKAGIRFITQYPEYVDACWGNIVMREKQSYNGSDQRFEKAVYINSLVQKVQFIRESTSEKTAILDEGLVNGIGHALYKSNSSEDEKQEIEGILQKMPLPHGVVYITSEIEENIKRLMARKKVVSSFQGLKTEELSGLVQVLRRRREHANDILRKLGVPVWVVDSKDSIQDNAARIISFAENLNSFHTVFEFDSNAIRSTFTCPGT